MSMVCMCQAPFRYVCHFFLGVKSEPEPEILSKTINFVVLWETVALRKIVIYINDEYVAKFVADELD